jgi:hypothetical protein
VIATLEAAAAALGDDSHPSLAKRRGPATDLTRPFVVGLDPADVDELAELEELRPRTRADCANVPRPCPIASCRYNLGLHVKPNGTILVNLAGYRGSGRGRALNPRKVADGGAAEVTRLIREAVDHLVDRDPATSCVLDLADTGGHGYDAIAAVLNVSKERPRQVVEGALEKIRASGIDLEATATAGAGDLENL